MVGFSWEEIEVARTVFITAFVIVIIDLVDSIRAIKNVFYAYLYKSIQH